MLQAVAELPMQGLDLGVARRELEERGGEPERVGVVGWTRARGLRPLKVEGLRERPGVSVTAGVAAKQSCARASSGSGDAALAASKAERARARLGDTDAGVRLAEASFVGWVGGGAPCLKAARRILAQVRSLSGASAEALVEFESLCDGPNDTPAMLSGHLICRAEALVGVGRVREAEAELWAATALAREMSAKGWELRAATHLARLLQDRGDRAAARDALLPVCQGFAEGADAADFKDALAMVTVLA